MLDWNDIKESPPTDVVVQVLIDCKQKDYAFLNYNGIWSMDGVTHWREITPVNEMLDNLERMEEKYT